jgi:hypothetical protein
MCIILLIILFSFNNFNNASTNGFDETGNFRSIKHKLFFEKPRGEYAYGEGALFFKVPDALCEYYNINDRVTFTLMALNTTEPLSFIGNYIRFHITGIGTQIEIVDDNIWLLKKNAITLMQRYKFFVKDRLYYMTVYIIGHKNHTEKKAALMVSSPFELFYRLRDEGYTAYLNFNFLD